MNITVNYDDGRLGLALIGELDHHAAKIAMEKIGDAVDNYLPRDCVLNLAALSFMDSSGIAVLLSAKRRMEELDGRAWIEGIAPQPLKVLNASGVYRLIDIKETAGSPS